jgi:hypothetical protein
MPHPFPPAAYCIVQVVPLEVGVHYIHPFRLHAMLRYILHTYKVGHSVIHSSMDVLESETQLASVMDLLAICSVLNPWHFLK